MSYLPLFALMMVPRHRRDSLLPVALPAMANLPAAQLGALAVVTSDSRSRSTREQPSPPTTSRRTRSPMAS
jgi:hypothetical protein